MRKLSVLIPVFNSEKTIRQSLESVKWADEVVVVDSGSTDSTLAICREYTNRILSHEYINSASQKNWAIPQCSHAWVFQLDSDEILEEGLEKEIRKVLEEDAPQIHAFRLRRKNFAYGKWLRHGAFYPDYQIRLFRRDSGRFEDKEVHAHILVPGEIKSLEGHLLHYDFKDISAYLIKFERYMRYECDRLVKEKKPFSFARVTFYPFALFVRDYFFKLGFLDGWPGFLSAVLRSFYYFTAYSKLWEHEWKLKNRK